MNPEFDAKTRAGVMIKLSAIQLNPANAGLSWIASKSIRLDLRNNGLTTGAARRVMRELDGPQQVNNVIWWDQAGDFRAIDASEGIEFSQAAFVKGCSRRQSSA